MWISLVRKKGKPSSAGKRSEMITDEMVSTGVPTDKDHKDPGRISVSVAEPSLCSTISDGPQRNILPSPWMKFGDCAVIT
jgi:hypothetical protein